MLNLYILTGNWHNQSVKDNSGGNLEDWVGGKRQLQNLLELGPGQQQQRRQGSLFRSSLGDSGEEGQAIVSKWLM